jgi:hypothetical protein
MRLQLGRRDGHGVGAAGGFVIAVFAVFALAIFHLALVIFIAHAKLGAHDLGAGVVEVINGPE